MSEFDKTIRYRVRFDFSQAKQDGDKAAQEMAAKAQQDAKAGAERREREQQQATSRSAPRAPRGGRQPTPSSGYSGLANALNNFTGMFGRAQRGVGPNSVIGQTMRGFGIGGMGPFANFARYFMGNLNFPATHALLGRMGSGAGGALTRGALGRVIGGAGLRGLGGMIAGPAGAAAAGAGPIGLAVGAVVLSIGNIVKAFGEFGSSLKHFAGAFTSGGDVSQALHGLVDYAQSIGRVIGGPILGAITSKIIGLGHAMIGTMDGLVKAFGRWSPIVAQQQARYQMAQAMFSMRMGQVLEPILSAWMNIKLKLLDAFAAIAERIMHFASGIFYAVSAVAKFAGFILKISGVTAIFDALIKAGEWLHKAWVFLIQSIGKFAVSMINLALKYAPKGMGGALKDLRKSINEFVQGMTGATGTVTEAAKAMARKFFGVGSLPPGLTTRPDRITSVPPLGRIQNPGDFNRGKGHWGNGRMQPLAFMPNADLSWTSPAGGLVPTGAIQDFNRNLKDFHNPYTPEWQGRNDSSNSPPTDEEMRRRQQQNPVARAPAVGVPAPNLHVAITQHVQMQLSHEQQIHQAIFQLRDRLIDDFKTSRDEAALAVSYIRGSIYTRGM